MRLKSTQLEKLSMFHINLPKKYIIYKKKLISLEESQHILI